MGTYCDEAIVLARAISSYNLFCDCLCGELAHFEIRIDLIKFDRCNSEAGGLPRRLVKAYGRSWAQLFCCTDCHDELLLNAKQLTVNN